MKKLFLLFILEFVCLVSFGQNYALQFDGIDDYVECPSQINNSIRTVELWFKLDSAINADLVKFETLLVRNTDDFVPNQPGEFGLFFSSLAQSNGKLIFFRRIGGTYHEVVSDNNNWQADVWYHVAGTIDPVLGMKLYIDAVEQTDFDMSTAPVDMRAEVLTLGNWSSTADRYLTGEIDRIRLWNRALSQLEIDQKRCKILVQQSELDLAAYWELNEGNGIIALDEVGQSDAAIIGATYISAAYCIGAGSINQHDIIEIVVVPNPSVNYCTVNMKDNNDAIKEIFLTALNGQQTLALRNINRNSVNIDTSNLPSGIYFYRIISEKGTAVNGKLSIIK